MMDSRLLATVAKADVAIGLVMSLLIDKGVISGTELHAALDDACRKGHRASQDDLTLSILSNLKSFIIQ